MKPSFLFLSKGFEEISAVAVVDVLRRAGVEVKMVSMTNGHNVTGAHGITIMADELFEKVQFDKTDFLILPGGLESTKDLTENEDFRLLLQDHYNKGLRIAAIGESPALLGELGMLKDKNATSVPGYEDFLLGATYTGVPVEMQGKIITGRSPEDAMKFAIAIVSVLQGKDVADKVAHELLMSPDAQPELR